MPERRPGVVILGAGPAGLGAAYKLAGRGLFDVTVVERQSLVGGNAGSFEIAGLRVDYGSHRLHPACAPEILQDIQGMLGADLMDRPRHGRMHLRGRWVHFPLKPLDLSLHLPLSFSFGVLADAALKLGRKPDESSFESVLRHGLGRTICDDFYFPYARKIWGVAPDQLDAEQARRRVSAGSLGKMIRKVLNAVPGWKPKGAGRFYYPRRGYGQIPEAYYCAALKAGARMRLSTPVTGLDMEAGRIRQVLISEGGSQEKESAIPASLVLSTIPVTQLARMVHPAAPVAVLQSAASLRYRAMILVYLVLETGQYTEYDAHYFPDPSVAITRLSEPKNYGLAALPGRTVLCAELPCSTEERVWSAGNEELGELVCKALAVAGLPRVAPLKVESRRLAQAYPIYTRDYRMHFDRVDQWLNTIDGVVTFGRQGLFAHDNTHHALAMAYALNDSLDDTATLNRGRWEAHRREFARHVVED